MHISKLYCCVRSTALLFTWWCHFVPRRWCHLARCWHHITGAQWPTSEHNMWARPVYNRPTLQLERKSLWPRHVRYLQRGKWLACTSLPTWGTHQQKVENVNSWFIDHQQGMLYLFWCKQNKGFPFLFSLWFRLSYCFFLSKSKAGKPSIYVA